MSAPYTAIARYPYEPDPENASDDLPLQPDQIITVTEVVDDDWLFGSYNDDSGNTRSGYFPKSFVEPYSEPSPETAAPTSAAETANASDPVTTSELVSQSEPTQKEEPKESGATSTEPVFGSLDPKLKDIEENIVHEPENFKNKLQSFNVSSTPLMPMEKPKEESFVRKPFSATDHRTSYVPPSLGTNKTVRKEEKKPDVVSGDIVSESSKVEEVEAPRMTLKERMQLLQQQQAEEQKAIEAALKRKEERKKAKHQIHHHPTEGVTDASNPETMEGGEFNDAKSVNTRQSLDLGSNEGGNLEPSTLTDLSGEKVQSAIHTQARRASGEVGGDKEENEEDDEEEEEEEREGEEEEASNNADADADADDAYDDDDDDDDDDEETEEDEEELRKRRLAERMAKLSRGMGMMGMMGMMGAPIPAAPTTNKKTKKSKKEKKAEDDMEGVPEAIPILPLAGSAIPSAIAGSSHLETETNALSHPVASSSTKESHAENASSSDDEVFEDTVESATTSPKKVTSATASTPTMNTHPFRQQINTPTAPAPAILNIASPGAPPIPGSAVPAPPLSTSTTTVTPSAPAVPITRAPQPATTAPSESIPPIPKSRAPTTRAPPPAPPVTSPPVHESEDEASSPTYSAPPIPNVPPTMPHTAPASRPPMPPPVPTTTTQGGATPAIGVPPPIPGSVPTIPSPTQIAGIPPPPPPHAQAPVPMPAPSPVPIPAPSTDNISRHSSIRAPPVPLTGAPSIPIAPPTAAPPVPNMSKRHSTVGHAPPPPPPAASVPAVPQSKDNASIDNNGTSIVQRQFTRSSLETANSVTASTEELPIKIPSSSSPASEYWWTTESLPPQLTKTETYFEVESTDIHKRGGQLIKYLIYYVLDAHLTCITMELAYNTNEPERLLFFHETKEKSKADRKKLIEEYTKYGPLAYNTAVKSLNKSYNGEYINFIFSNLPKDVLQPIASKTFGAVVYRNNNGEAKSFDDIRPGDILVLVDAVFEGHRAKEVGFGKPHVSLVTSYDSEKSRFKVIEQVDGLIQQGRYKLKNMKSGKLRVFRIVGRDYVNW